MKKALCVLLALLLFPAPALAQEGPLCVEVMGYRPMVVVYEVEDGKIASFEVVEHQEAPGHGAEVIAAGFDSLIGQDVQSARFDAVSGATRTSNGINGALRLAAQGAGKPYPGAAPAPAADLAAAQEAPPPPEAAAFPGDSFTFRDGISFGMSIEQVRALEPGDCLQTENGLVYLDRPLDGLYANIDYWFNDDALTEVYVSFREVPEDEALYLADFAEVDASLTAKYGPAYLLQADGSDDPSSGQPEPYSVWFMDGYTIYHKIYIDSNVRSHHIFFTSAAYEDNADESSASSFTFRNGVSFGMTMEQVRALEPDSPSQTENILRYFDQQFAGLDVYIRYWFNGNALTEVYVSFEEVYADDTPYFVDFDKAEAELTLKYGPASVTEEDTPGVPSSGEPELYSMWVMDGYTIYHDFYGDSDGRYHYIFFTSDAYEDEEDDIPKAPPEAAALPGDSLPFQNGVAFGMSMEQVRALEPGDPLQTEDSLTYYGQRYAGFQTEVFYFFTDNQLSFIDISFTEAHADDALYLADFADVEAALTAAYGPAIFSDEPASDDSDLLSMWTRDGCAIYHSFYNSSDEPLHFILSVPEAYVYEQDASPETSPAPTAAPAPEASPAPVFFRSGVALGMSMEQVRALELGNPSQTEDSLTYYGQRYAGLEMYVCYSFSANRLSSILVSFTASHADDALYRADFAEAEAVLTEKYGPASLSRSDGTNRPSIWFMDGCTLLHELHGDSGSLVHSIRFTTDAFDDE